MATRPSTRGTSTSEQLSALERRLSGLDHLVVQTMRGLDASEEILQVAREHRAELVVIGLRRRSPSASC